MPSSFEPVHSIISTNICLCLMYRQLLTMIYFWLLWAFFSITHLYCFYGIFGLFYQWPALPYIIVVPCNRGPALSLREKGCCLFKCFYLNRIHIDLIISYYGFNIIKCVNVFHNCLINPDVAGTSTMCFLYEINRSYFGLLFRGVRLYFLSIYLTPTSYSSYISPS